MKTTRANADVTYFNQRVADLRTTQALTPEATEQVHHVLGNAPTEFISDKMLKEAWRAKTGTAPTTDEFRRLRGEVLYAVIANKVPLEASKVRGHIAGSLRLLASKNTTVKSDSEIFNKACGGPIANMEMVGECLHLRVAGGSRDDGKTAAIVGSGGTWNLHLPDGNKMALAPSEAQRAVMTHGERRTSAAANNEVRELLSQFLALPEAEGGVRMHANPFNLDGRGTAFAREALAAMDAADGRKTVVTPEPLSVKDVGSKELTKEARAIIHAFRTGTLASFGGDGTPDTAELSARALNYESAHAAVGQLVAFIAEKESVHWGQKKLQQISKDNSAATRTPNEMRADALLNGFSSGRALGLNELHLVSKEIEIENAPRAIQQWVAENIGVPKNAIIPDREQMLGTIWTPRRYEPDNVELKRIDGIHVDGELTAYAVTYERKSSGQEYAAVFEKDGKFLANRYR